MTEPVDRFTYEIHPSWPTAARNPSGLTDTAVGRSGRGTVLSSRVTGSKMCTALGNDETATMRSSAELYSASSGRNGSANVGSTPGAAAPAWVTVYVCPLTITVADREIV